MVGICFYFLTTTMIFKANYLKINFFKVSQHQRTQPNNLINNVFIWIPLPDQTNDDFPNEILNTFATIDRKLCLTLYILLL